MPKNLTTTEQNQELIAKKTKNLMNLTKKILNKDKTQIIKKESNTITQTDNSFIEPQMVKIEAGEFMMGGDWHEDEKPIHKVTINKPFLIGKQQVTFKEYDKFCEDTNREKPDDRGWGRENRPVINVSWDDVNEYCKWLSKKTNKTYHLPSETQWEYACRAGTTTKYSFGDNIKELKEYAWYDENSYDLGVEHKDYGSHPVGEKKPNPWGLYDMHGNVYEWCEDWYDDNYNHTPRDESANTDGDKEYKVLRGGSWGSDPFILRSAFRDRVDRGSAVYYGFRLAGTLP